MMSTALVIEDNRATADALQRMLTLLGIEGRVAYGPGPAMALMRNWAPSLILLDINMPGVDGIEILAYLRREPRLAPVPVVVITSDDQAETRKKVMDGGARAIIIKPVALDALEATLKPIGVLP